MQLRLNRPAAAPAALFPLQLRMWEMTQYDRMVYLDADMILLKSTGELINCFNRLTA